MDLFSAIETRASCRQFLEDPVDRQTIEKILTAGGRAPSPLNTQPWQFMVITGPEKKQAIHDEAERCREWAVEKSGWKWMGKYKTDFLLQAPVLIVVVGDPKKSGMDMFQEEGSVGYQLACAAAIQNMLLAAHDLGLGSLWFTLYDKGHLRKILTIAEDKTPVSIVCIGKPGMSLSPVPRKAVAEKTVYLDE
jgi:5,6-dimethylbenzimidazole synthase